MKKLLLIILLSTLGFAASEPEITAKVYKMKAQQYFQLYCIEGYEFIEDNQGNLHQIFEKSSYKLTGIEAIPIQLPKECKEQK